MSAAVLVCDGDSNTSGFGLGAGQDWPAQVVALLTGDFVKFNVAVAGRTIADMLAAAPVSVDTKVDPAGEWFPGSPVGNVYVQMGGTNMATADARTIHESHLVPCCNGRIVAGFDRIVLLTVLPHNVAASSRAKTTRLLLNAYRRRYASQICDVLVDLDLVPELTDVTNLTYFQADQSHVTAAGALKIAEAAAIGIMAAVNM